MMNRVTDVTHVTHSTYLKCIGDFLYFLYSIKIFKTGYVGYTGYADSLLGVLPEAVVQAGLKQLAGRREIREIEKMSDTADTGDTHLWFPAADIHQSNSAKSYRESSPSEVSQP